MLTELAITEPGPNFQGQKFSRCADHTAHSFIPGWDLPDRWHAKTAPEYVRDPGVPTDGHLLVSSTESVLVHVCLHEKRELVLA